jgi:D-sedoheptulose 7-phosphate isomerase
MAHDVGKSTTQWAAGYLAEQAKTIASIPPAAVAELVGRLREALVHDRQVFVCGNGGSAANASHFATDLGKGASDKLSKRFRCMSLNDNAAWMTAIGNDYSFEDLFVRQLHNHARKGDLLIVMSVSGNSPNLVKAVEWAKDHGLHTAALLSGRRGKLAELADTAIVIKDDHYGRVEDAHMGILHMLCYAFMELPEVRANLQA